jgi:glutamate formiminotransferase/formiminotetrahydrofolate cyclodeaminase
MKQLIECVPNFSEGRDMSVIKAITDEIESVDGVKLLDVDPGKATNRTVVTIVGEPNAVIQAAFLGIKKASELINMSQHLGEHPRMGATDVCPFVPISGISMEETAEYAHQLAKKVGEELAIPCYMYESAATSPERKNLATVRQGEYEGLPEKLANPNWKPDYGPAAFNAKSGATAFGARDFLIAYNVNLNTTSVRRANSVAFDIREKGRILRKGNDINGEIVRDENGDAVRQAGACKGVKAIGWYIEEYGVSQISMNITNVKQTPLHVAFQETRSSANKRGLRVTGSELVGLVPLQVMLETGRFFLKMQERSVGISEEETIKIAIKSLGLDELSPFDPKQRIIEYRLREDTPTPLVEMDLRSFANETASESMAPGGGSISAYVGALGVSLGTMVANLSAHKRGWDDRWEEFSEWADRGQELKDALLNMVDEDTNAFNKIMEAFRLPKGTADEKATRKAAIQAATQYAIEVPLKVMELTLETFDVIKAMANIGNPASITDAAVGALCARAAIRGAFLNVRINAKDLKDETFVMNTLAKGMAIEDQAAELEREILALAHRKM